MHFIRIVITIDYATYILWDLLFDNIISDSRVPSQISLGKIQDSDQFLIYDFSSCSASRSDLQKLNFGFLQLISKK